MSTDPGSPHLGEDALTLFCLGDDDAVGREVARRHLAGCEVCRDELEQIREALDLVADAGLPEAPAGFERVMWARVSARLDASRPAGWRAWFTPSRLAFAGGALTLVLVAFVGGRWSRPPAAPAPAELLVTLSPETARQLVAEDHFELAQMVLSEVLYSEGSGADLEAERARAADLVAANRLIRQSMSAATPDAMADVLDDLERILIEFVNRADGWSPDEQQAFKARLAAGDILFRLRVVSAEMRQRTDRRQPPLT